MDKDVVAAKLESLRRCVERIEEKRPDSAQALLDNYDLQDIISVNLERAVQVSADIASHFLADTQECPPSSMGAGFESLAKSGTLSAELADRMRKAVGFRNISVHAYQEIDWQIVFSIITTRMDDFKEFSRSIQVAIEVS